MSKNTNSLLVSNLMHKKRKDLDNEVNSRINNNENQQIALNVFRSNDN